MIILLFGAPGVGKGTQAELLSKRNNFIKFSMGDILRQEISSKGSLSSKIEHYVNQGILVPDNVIFDLVDKFLVEHKDNNILFDGFPRTVIQAKTLDKSLAQLELAPETAIELHLAEDEIIKRLVNRRYCPECGKIYNYITDPPEVDGVCDLCHRSLVKRADDDEKIIRKRLEVYQLETSPLVDYYKALSIYIQIDASGIQEEIFKKISNVLHAYIIKE
jgi:adenylate kinase